MESITELIESLRESVNVRTTGSLAPFQARGGQIVYILVSDDVCKPITGFKLGDLIVTPSSEMAMFIGTSDHPHNQNKGRVIWYIKENQDGENGVTYWEFMDLLTPENVSQAGFRIIPERTHPDFMKIARNLLMNKKL